VTKLILEYRGDSTNKFWEPSVEGSIFIVRFGKIDTNGQKRFKELPSTEEAIEECRKVTRQKLAKGYKPTNASYITLLNERKKTSSPVAVCAGEIGEHFPDEMASDICGWLTACIQSDISSKRFQEIWGTLLEEDDEECVEALGWTMVEEEKEAWVDHMQMNDLEMVLYPEAVKIGADGFIWLRNEFGETFIVAVKGDPGARAIEVSVDEIEEGEEGDDDEQFIKWPEKLGPGAPILHIIQNQVTLRDETKIEGRRL
jgi:predicted DNA-binding WGR domain protein